MKGGRAADDPCHAHFLGPKVSSGYPPPRSPASARTSTLTKLLLVLLLLLLPSSSSSSSGSGFSFVAKGPGGVLWVTKDPKSFPPYKVSQQQRHHQSQ